MFCWEIEIFRQGTLEKLDLHRLLKIVRRRLSFVANADPSYRRLPVRHYIDMNETPSFCSKATWDEEVGSKRPFLCIGSNISSPYAAGGGYGSYNKGNLLEGGMLLTNRGYHA